MTVRQADYILIPLLDGRHAVAQVFEVDDTPPDTLLCGLTDLTLAAPGPVAHFPTEALLGVHLTRADLITSGAWSVAGFDQIPRFQHLFDAARAATDNYTDVPVRDPAVIEAYLNAWHGLYPWDSFGPLFDEMTHPDAAPSRGATT